jgi:hypothetical protein
MLILQANDLADSFQDHMGANAKYMAMINNINETLYKAYKEEKRRADQDDGICQKSET